MAYSIKKKNSTCSVMMFLKKLANYERGIVDLVLDLVLKQMVRDYIIVTFYLKYCTKIKNKQLQLIVNKYFKYFWEGTIELDIISRFIEFEIKINRIEFEKNKIYSNCSVVIVNNYYYIRMISIKSYIQKDYYYSWDFSNINNAPKRINNKLKYQRDINTRHQNKHTEILSSKRHTSNGR